MKKVIIIGAGPAGLTAAYQILKETDMTPIVIEETGEIGGISRTVTYKGNRMDIGGHRFFTKNKQVQEIWNELMPTQGAPSKEDIELNVVKPFNIGGPDPEKEDKVMLIRNRVSRIFYLRKFFDYPISIKPITFKNMGFKRTMKAGFGYLGSMIHKRKECSLEDFYINRFGKPLYEMFFEDYTEKLWGVHPSKISPDWGAQRVKGLSLKKAIADILAKAINKNHKSKETSLIEQFSYPKKGPGQLWETMAEEIIKMGGEIRLNSKVEKVMLNEKTIQNLEITTADGKECLSGDYYFSTMPVKDVIEAMGQAVPSTVLSIAKELPYRDFITVGLLLKKLKIKNNTPIKTVGSRVPDCWIYIQERDVKIGRLQIFNNWSPYMVDNYHDTVWIGLEYFCNENDAMWNQSEEEFIQFAIDELVRIDVIDRKDVLDATHIRVKKAYPAYFGSYKNFDLVKEYLNSVDNLYCMGRNGQHRYNNMDHSMLTAIEAVNLIKKNSNNREELWNVNTEEEYHEEKK